MRQVLLALFHEAFCRNRVQRVPDLALFPEMADYLFPATCSRCGSRRLYEGREIRAAFAKVKPHV